MTSPDTMAAVLRQPIDLAALPRGTPTAVRRSSSAALNASRASDCATSARRGWRSNESARHRRAALLLQPESRRWSRSARTVCRGSCWRITVAALVALLGALLGPRAQPSVPAPVYATREQHRRARLPDGRRRAGGRALARRSHHRLRVRRENTPRRTCAASSSSIRLSSRTEGATNPFFHPTEPSLDSSHPAASRRCPWPVAPSRR